MLFCQLGRAHSLREICQGLAACEGKLKHLGVVEAPKRTSLSYANSHRPWQMYQSLFELLYQRFQIEAAGKGNRFGFKHKLLSIDSTTVSLCASVFHWADYQRTKGAMKVHLVLDHDGYMPRVAVVSDGKKSDISVAIGLDFPPGTMLIFDRGYVRYGWWLALTRRKVRFVSRLKDNAVYKVVEDRVGPLENQIVRDQTIVFPGQKRRGKEAHFRLVEIYDKATAKNLVFITNDHLLEASIIAEIYKERWQIELFFRSLKQLLKIKTFVGTSENAVQIQIWTALITMLLLRYLKLRSSYKWSLSNLVALLRQQLFVYRPLWEWLNNPFQPPPPPPEEQLSLWPAPA
jgi:hypothetical protein